MKPGYLYTLIELNSQLGIEIDFHYLRVCFVGIETFEKLPVASRETGPVGLNDLAGESGAVQYVARPMGMSSVDIVTGIYKREPFVTDLSTNK